MTWTNAIGHGAMNQRNGDDKVIPERFIGTAALRDFIPVYDR